ncbi:hypothetical protein TSOC_007039 [Tetrabaena socialis]|uniref:Uncharacterized protein n=1 Tax=Tetrabaena socialis TaxID=47790 RepID=A0A2J8A253_9CHLO|nr:hypothetical protein TSOC_007039 [Tetrabaena socialis]|eukprot:PNH06597.1 hypothetical protein TSOC_007039 [Tetrabaena socialis]
MGAYFSRRQNDTYYANYEKSFERLEKESTRILDRRVKRRRTMDACSNMGFWATALGICVAILLTAYLQQVSGQKWYKKSVTILAAFAVPLVSALLSKGVLWMLRFGEARDERFLRKLMDAKRKMVKDLKDSTRFDRTAALIKKYDPDEPADIPRGTTPAGAASGNLRRRPNGATSPSRTPNAASAPRPGASTPGSMLMRPAQAAASAAASVATGTGNALMPIMQSLANNFVGDNPVLLQEAQTLREQNIILQAKLVELEARMQAADARLDHPPQQPAAAPDAGQVAPSG